jgi:hypothetical protein
MTRRRFLLSLGAGMISLAAVAAGVLAGSQGSLARANLLGESVPAAHERHTANSSAAPVCCNDSPCCEACPDCPPCDLCPACPSCPSP